MLRSTTGSGDLGACLWALSPAPRIDAVDLSAAAITGDRLGLSPAGPGLSTATGFRTDIVNLLPLVEGCSGPGMILLRNAEM